MNPFAAIDWPTIVAFVLIEVGIVLLAAPLIIQKRNEDRAVEVFKTKLLPLFPAPPTVPTVEELAAAVRAALPMPSPEAQAEAQAQLAARIGEAVQASVGEAVAANIGNAAKTMSAAGVNARQDYAAKEEQFKMAVFKHEKGGMLTLGALEGFKAMFPGTYKFAVNTSSLDPTGAAIDDFLVKHGDKLRLGFGKDDAPKRNGLTVV